MSPLQNILKTLKFSLQIFLEGKYSFGCMNYGPIVKKLFMVFKVMLCVRSHAMSWSEHVIQQ